VRRAGAAVWLALFASAAGRGDQIVQVGPGFSFSPSTVTIAPGEAVVWNFLALHTATSDVTTGPEVWDSGFLSSGTFSHTFSTPGSYPYYCRVHSSPGGTAMNGVVQVAGASPTPTPIPPTLTAPPATPTSTPPAGVPTATPPGDAPAIPALDDPGRALLILALALAGIAALVLSHRR